MRLIKKQILGIGVTKNSKKQILEYIEKYLGKSAKKPLVMVTPNPEQMVLAQKDTHFRILLNRADVAIPDGIGLALALGCRKISGIDLMEDLVSMAARRSLPIALIGGRGGVAVAALECLKGRFSRLAGWAMEPGDYNNYKNYNFYKCYNKIIKTKVRIVFVGLGAPKQEYFISRLASQDTLLRTQESVLLMSVGGAFDIISGKTPRASRAIRALSLEWLWRLILESWRWRRQMSLLRFLWLVLKTRFFHTKSTI